MRKLEDARASWQTLAQYKTLRDARDGVRLGEHGPGLRSVLWKAFLLVHTLRADEWQRTLASSRSAYNALHAHLFRDVRAPGEPACAADPCAADGETSPRHPPSADDELRAEIVQDVERQSILQQPAHRRILTDVLFTFCKLNPDVGYRQGMHEIAASIIWVVEGDAIELGGASKALGEDAVVTTVFDAEYIEHDSFAVFGQIMQNAKAFYMSEGPVSIAARSRYIFNDLLASIDADLVKHLESLDVLPQVFLIRWIRLLFGREFEFHSVLALWDVIFAQDPSLEIVDHICLAMILRIHWHLLDADYNNALALLLRYPELDKDTSAQSLALDALYLRDHMTAEGSSYLVLKYTGRPLSPGRPTTPPALQRNMTQFSGLNAVRNAARSSFSPSAKQSRNNIESVLQNTAKNLFAQSERLGIGKAVRSTIDDIHKRAQDIRDAQAPSPPPWRRSGPPRVLERLKDLEERNKRLSVLLGNAVNELWECQQLVCGYAMSVHGTEPAVEKLSAAIARVQFVSVYLDEPTLILPPDDDTPVGPKVDDSQECDTLQADASRPSPNDKATGIPSQQEGVNDQKAQPLADPLTVEDFGEPLIDPGIVLRPGAIHASPEGRDDTATRDAGTSGTVTESSTPRPSLEQSHFSFMLGRDSSTKESRELEVTSRPSSRTHASLFAGGAQTNSTPSTASKAKSSTCAVDSGGDEFDFGSLRRGKGPKR